MKQLTINEIYNLELPEMSFKMWLDGNKKTYNNLINSGKLSKNINFISWLNIEHNKKNLSADGDSVLDVMKDVIVGGVKQAKEAISSEGKTDKNTIESNVDVEKQKTILGLKPVVAYGISGVVLLSAAILVLKYRKYLKS